MLQANGILFKKDVSKGLSIMMAFIFVMFYFTINLSLFKYILFFHLLDDEDNDVSICKWTIPTRKQTTRFLVATLYFMLCTVGVYSIVVLIAFLLYTQG